MRQCAASRQAGHTSLRVGSKIQGWSPSHGLIGWVGGAAHFFLYMTDLYALVEQSVAGLGVEIVDVERLGRGLLRVTIDREDGVRIEDCEVVSRQLSRVFEVENISYEHLEVSSPGTDRPLRRVNDYFRFAGERAQIRLRAPFEGRRTFTGILRAPESDSEAAEGQQPGDTAVPAAGAPIFRLEFEATNGETQVLHFTLDEVERAKLDPVLDFKGKKR